VEAHFKLRRKYRDENFKMWWKIAENSQHCCRWNVSMLHEASKHWTKTLKARTCARNRHELSELLDFGFFMRLSCEKRESNASFYHSISLSAALANDEKSRHFFLRSLETDEHKMMSRYY
jgi:hypothetical protein